MLIDIILILVHTLNLISRIIILLLNGAISVEDRYFNARSITYNYYSKAKIIQFFGEFFFFNNIPRATVNNVSMNVIKMDFKHLIYLV